MLFSGLFFLFFCFVFFCNGRIIVLASAFVLFIIRNVIVLLVGRWLGLVHLCLWLVVLALLRKRERGDFQEQAGRSNVSVRKSWGDTRTPNQSDSLKLGRFWQDQPTLVCVCVCECGAAIKSSIPLQSCRGQHKPTFASRTCRDRLHPVAFSTAEHRI